MLRAYKGATSEFSVGMFVSAFDRPCPETSFITRDCVIESADDISRLQKYCERVQIDFRRNHEPQAYDIDLRRVAPSDFQAHSVSFLSEHLSS